MLNSRCNVFAVKSCDLVNREEQEDYRKMLTKFMAVGMMRTSRVHAKSIQLGALICF